MRERGWSISPTAKGPFHIPNWKGAGPYPQLERGKSTRRYHLKLPHPTHPPTHSPIRGVKSTPKIGVGITNSPQSCPVCTLHAPCALALPVWVSTTTKCPNSCTARTALKVPPISHIPHLLHSCIPHRTSACHGVYVPHPTSHIYLHPASHIPHPKVSKSHLQYAGTLVVLYKDTFEKQL